MILDLEPELIEDNLNNFISEKESEIRDGKDRVISKLQKKASRLCKQETNNDQEKEDFAKQANEFTEVAMFLRKYPPDKLMTMALLDKKSLTEVYNSPDRKLKQRALFHFASRESMKTLILEFREQYPNWKKAKGLISSKMEENNNEEILSELTNTLETDENDIKSKKLKKKKALKRKEEMKEDGSDDPIGNESCEMPKKKKVKKASSDNNSSENEEMKNSEEEKKETRKYTPKNIKKKQKKMRNQSNKMNATERTLVNGSSNPADTSESMVGFKVSLEQQSPHKRQQKGKFHKISSKKQGFKKNGSQLMGESKKNGGKDNANMINGSPKKDNEQMPSILQKSTSFLLTSTSPKKDDGQKPSLLRPTWLTNPEEYKPPPISNTPPAFNRQRDFKSRGSGFRGRGGRGNRFRGGDPNSSNMINVSDDWKTKCNTPKSEDTDKPSLLRPDWLVNPQEYKPEPSFKRLGGNFRGGRRGGRKKR